jgi:hypothetical protein
MRTFVIIFPLSSNQINGAKESVAEIIEDFGKRNVKVGEGNGDDAISFALECNKVLSAAEIEDITKISDRHDCVSIFINTDKNNFPNHIVFDL